MYLCDVSVSCCRSNGNNVGLVANLHCHDIRVYNEKKWHCSTTLSIPVIEFSFFFFLIFLFFPRSTLCSALIYAFFFISFRCCRCPLPTLEAFFLLLCLFQLLDYHALGPAAALHSFLLFFCIHRRRTDN